jgi:hypothetical protein
MSAIADICQKIDEMILVGAFGLKFTRQVIAAGKRFQ